MEVIKNNFDPEVLPEPPRSFWRLVCGECGSVLNFTKDDVSIGEYGMASVVCPLCGSKNPLYEHPETEEDEDFFNLILTKDNIKFPTHFTLFESKGEIDEAFSTRVEEAIRKGIEYLRKHKDQDGYWYTYSGDRFVLVCPYTGDEQYYVAVAKGFYDAVIPFEDIDYQIFSDDPASSNYSYYSRT